MPVAVLGTDAFLSLARAAAATHGLPHLPVAMVPHPIGGLDPGEVRTKAERVVDLVLAALTRDPPPPETAAASARLATAAPDDLEGFQAFALAEGWGDGLPVLPPTPERVERMLGRHAAARETLVATLAPEQGPATLEAVAVNAALAGAGPEHFPLIVAAVRAVADPAFNLNAVQTTTHPCTPLVIVNGPIARELGVGAGANALGQGHRANAVIGRALRLVLQNVGGARPGETDRATLGHPGKFAYCLAENEAESPWDSLAVERGFRRDESCVTVSGADAPTNVNDHGSTTAEALLLAFIGTAAATGTNNIYLGGEPLLIVGPEHARTFAGSGWSKRDLKTRLWERARVRLDHLSRENLARFARIDPERFGNRPADAEVAIARRAEDVMVIVAGGPGKHSAFVPTFGATRAVTVRV